MFAVNNLCLPISERCTHELPRTIEKCTLQAAISRSEKDPHGSGAGEPCNSTKRKAPGTGPDPVGGLAHTGAIGDPA